MVSLDEIVAKILSHEIPYKKEKCPSCSQNINEKCKYNFKNSSTDALYVQYLEDSVELYFIEFKKEDLFNQHTKLIPEIEELLDNLKIYISKIDEDPTITQTLEAHLNIKINEKWIDESKNLLKESKGLIKKPCKDSLRLKPLESLSCVMPWIYRLYCNDKDKMFNLNKFQSFLMECDKQYIVVHEIKKSNPSNGRRLEYAINHSCRNNPIPYEIQRLSPYPFRNINFKNSKDFNSYIEGISNPEKLLKERIS